MAHRLCVKVALRNGVLRLIKGIAAGGQEIIVRGCFVFKLIKVEERQCVGINIQLYNNIFIIARGAIHAKVNRQVNRIIVVDRHLNVFLPAIVHQIRVFGEQL